MQQFSNAGRYWKIYIEHEVCSVVREICNYTIFGIKNKCFLLPCSVNRDIRAPVFLLYVTQTKVRL